MAPRGGGLRAWGEEFVALRKRSIFGLAAIVILLVTSGIVAVLLTMAGSHKSAARTSERGIAVAPCTSAALSSAINATNTQPGGWIVLRSACQSGYAFISINPRTGGMQAVAILQQQGPSWKVIYGPNEGLCLTEPNLCPGFKLPLQRAVLRSLMQQISQ